MQRIELPGVDPEEREAFRKSAESFRHLKISQAVAIVRLGKHFYMGTVSPVEIEKRRTKNKAARKARRLNRS